MFKGNLKMAIASVRSFKWRALLTMTGIIIGVASVVTTVSLGQGIKSQVIGQINKLGSDLITIRPGRIVERGDDGRIVKINALNGYGFSSGSLPAKDLAAIRQNQNVKTVVPISIVSGGAKFDGRQFNNGYILGTTDDMASVLKQKVAYGDFFMSGDEQKQVAVIGRNVALRLFHDNVPVGRIMRILDQDFVVQGVLDVVDSSPLPLGPDFNNTIFIPYDSAQQITGGNSQLVQILVKPKDPNKTNETIASLNQTLQQTHGQQNDFAILRQDENLAVTGDVLNLLTTFVAGIAAISLLVGGIGIMNIMFLSVTERTREIGIRKAVGATDQQIMGQFLIEALLLSFLGSVIGLIVAGLANLGIRIFTHLQPVVTIQVIAIACLVSIAIGVIFGIIPAAKAARKDPIDALRFE